MKKLLVSLLFFIFSLPIFSQVEEGVSYEERIQIFHRDMPRTVIIIHYDMYDYWMYNDLWYFNYWYFNYRPYPQYWYGPNYYWRNYHYSYNDGWYNGYSNYLWYNTSSYTETPPNTYHGHRNGNGTSTQRPTSIPTNNNKQIKPYKENSDKYVPISRQTTITTSKPVNNAKKPIPNYTKPITIEYNKPVYNGRQPFNTSNNTNRVYKSPQTTGGKTMHNQPRR